MKNKHIRSVILVLGMLVLVSCSSVNQPPGELNKLFIDMGEADLFKENDSDKIVIRFVLESRSATTDKLRMVSIEMDKDLKHGTAVLKKSGTTKIANDWVIDEPNELVLDVDDLNATNIELTSEQCKKLNSIFKQCDFFNLERDNKQVGFDGEHWYFEAKVGARYQIIKRWSPDYPESNSAIVLLGREMLNLFGEKIT